MATSFFISDLHFGHENAIRTFMREDGTKLRNFSSVEEMNEFIIDRINSVVKPNDHLNIVGDLAMSKKYIYLAGRLNGHKRLVLGNHDIFNMELYAPYFEKIVGYRQFDKDIIVSHIPVHPSQLEQRFKFNIHGHLHDKNVRHANLFTDVRYFNVSCDNDLMQYVPKSLEELKEIAYNRGIDL
jgi:calcineurin-like phosphoesterase family protein